MGPTWFVYLLAAATVADGVLAGLSLDRSIAQLPARRRIGDRAYSAYSVAHEMHSPGVIWYPTLGLGAALLTVAAGITAALVAVPTAQALPVYLAAILSIAHTVVTARAATTNLRQRSVSGDDAALAHVLDRFTFWHGLRAMLQFATFIAMVWTLAINR